MSGFLQAAYRLLGWHTASRELSSGARAFSLGGQPVIRWFMSANHDDAIVRSAIAQATRLFGETVDYCICTVDISAPRIREILVCANQPVEWWPLNLSDNAQLAFVLTEARCDSEHFEQWWRWFPERVRPDAPEWIVDGHVMLVDRPEWFSAWHGKQDRLRVSQSDPPGLISLPPQLHFMPDFLDIRRQKLLVQGDDDQGVAAAAFGRLGAQSIPLSELPFARASDESLDYGHAGPGGKTWGYHFETALQRENPHFIRLTKEGSVYWRDTDPTPEERYIWMRNRGQWGRPGWSMQPICVQRVASRAKHFAGRPVLELGTSRGHLTAIMAASGCKVTTVDHTDRGARANLDGLGIDIVSENAAAFLRRHTAKYALITADLHGNGVAVWQELWPLLLSHLEENGEIILYNSHLHKIQEFRNETGISWVMQNIPKYISTEVFPEPLPGMVICRHE
jgi:protein-L-isoaspartate O-methyltransferase